MLVFWGVVGSLVTLLLGNAWRLDRRAARDGKVLVPVKAGFGRTRFVAVDRAERAAALREAAIEDHERERARRKSGPTDRGFLDPGQAALGLLGFGRRREH